MLADAASFAICAVVLLTLPSTPPARPVPVSPVPAATGPAGSAPPPPRLQAPRLPSVLRDLRYLTFCVLNGLC